MPTLRLTLKLDNEAFTVEAGGGYEVARILRKVADDLQPYNNVASLRGTFCMLRDVNGNQVGSVTVGK
jgi:hypothetical protein